MNQSKIYRALLLILGMTIAMSAPHFAIAADTTNTGTATSDSKGSKNDEKKDTATPSSGTSSGEKKGSGGSEPECN